jgi:hypothetical protein
VYNHYPTPNDFLMPYNLPTKGNQSLLGTQICLGPRMLVTNDFGTQMAFFLVPTIEVPTNLAYNRLHYVKEHSNAQNKIRIHS